MNSNNLPKTKKKGKWIDNIKQSPINLDNRLIQLKNEDGNEEPKKAGTSFSSLCQFCNKMTNRSSFQSTRSLEDRAKINQLMFFSQSFGESIHQIVGS